MTQIDHTRDRTAGKNPDNGWIGISAVPPVCHVAYWHCASEAARPYPNSREICNHLVGFCSQKDSQFRSSIEHGGQINHIVPMNTFECLPTRCASLVLVPPKLRHKLTLANRAFSRFYDLGIPPAKACCKPCSHEC